MLKKRKGIEPLFTLGKSSNPGAATLLDEGLGGDRVCVPATLAYVGEDGRLRGVGGGCHQKRGPNHVERGSSSRSRRRKIRKGGRHLSSPSGLGGCEACPRGTRALGEKS